MNQPGLQRTQPLVEPLTAREMEILSHLQEDRSNREIADALLPSLHTVKWYNRQIYGKRERFSRPCLADHQRCLHLYERLVPSKCFCGIIRSSVPGAIFRMRDFGRISAGSAARVACATQSPLTTNGRWQDFVAPYFEELGGAHVDENMLELEEVFHLD